MARALIVLLASYLSLGQAFRQHAKASLDATSADSAFQTKTIAGIPVYNYHLAYEHFSDTSSLAETYAPGYTGLVGDCYGNEIDPPDRALHVQSLAACQEACTRHIWCTGVTYNSKHGICMRKYRSCDKPAGECREDFCYFQKDGGEKVITWIIMMKSDCSKKQIQDLCDSKKTTCQYSGHVNGVPLVAVSGTESDLEALLKGNGGESSGADFIEPDLETYIIPEQPEIKGDLRANKAAKSWGLNRIGVSRRQYSGKGVHVYVLDTGIRTTHQDFGGRAISTLDLTSGRGTEECNGRSGCANDNQGHGTHCAGSAAGTDYGVAPGATIHAVKVLGDDGKGRNSWSAMALDWIITKGQRPAVASMSLGSKGNSHSQSRTISAATRAGVTVVVAAGNENDDACRYSPAFANAAITVGSTDSYDRRSSFSNYGKCVDIFAPGSNIKSLSYRSDYGTAVQSGTSMACPHVSGAAALLLEADPSQKAPAILDYLKTHGDHDRITGLTQNDQNVLLSVQPMAGGSASAPTLTIVGAKGLTSIESGWFGGNSDPYCRCSFSGSENKAFETPEDDSPPGTDGKLNPSWNKDWPLIGFDRSSTLTCEVFDKNEWQSDKSMGKVTLSGSQVLNGFDGDVSLSDGGTLTLRVTIPTTTTTTAAWVARCPQFAARLVPDADGDCACPNGQVCSMTGRYTDCKYSGGTGGDGGKYFKPSCTRCKCYRSR